jgi:hypothetical protein
MMENSYLLCDSHVGHAAFSWEHHGGHATLFGRPIDQLHPWEDDEKWASKATYLENAHFIPVEQETIYQSPYYPFVFWFTLLDSFKFLDPFLPYFLFDLDLLVFIEMFIGSMIRPNDACLLDVAKELNESIPWNSTCCCVPILNIVDGMDRRELLGLGKRRQYEMDSKDIYCIPTGTKSWIGNEILPSCNYWNNVRLGG